MRNVLLIEPNYSNKYPPIGLMKLATYHRRLGDNVVFFKGDLEEFVRDHIAIQCVLKLSEIDNSINWFAQKGSISQFFKTRRKEFLEPLRLGDSKFEFLLINWIDEFKRFYSKKLYKKEPYWDRICVSTLFTFYWDITIDTINFAKELVKDKQELWVGGVLATVLHKDVEKETGIKPWLGLLNKPGILDKNDIVIDELPLDYSILDEIDYRYSESNAYYGYTTRGCIRKCKFCAVPTLEPKFNKYISLKARVDETKRVFGEKRNLILLDNNVLASPDFNKIIKEIKKSGFVNGAKYIEPNELEITIKNLSQGINDNAYVKKAINLLHYLLGKTKNNTQQTIYNLLHQHDLLKIETATKDNILKLYPLVAEYFEKYRNKAPKLRYVDFNQGIDARLINENNIKQLSEIPINPLRIAFDSMKFRKHYEKAIKLGVNSGIKRFSNYLLYNYNDHPVDLYRRLKINVDLCDEFDIQIYSFPMKYHPIFGVEKLNREYLGVHWNRKFVRSVQAVLNSTKGKIGKGKSFFLKAFGNDENEFYKILYMPESFIVYRLFFEAEGFTDHWWSDFNSLNPEDLEIAKKIIELNDFKQLPNLSINSKINKVLQYYTISREDIQNPTSKFGALKEKFEEVRLRTNPKGL